MEKQRQDHNDIIRKRTDSEQTASRGRGGQQNIIIKTLSRRSFKNNRRRNLVAILAIVLTTMMFTTLFTLAQSLGRNMTEMYLRQSGTTAHTSTKSITDEEIEKIAAHPLVVHSGYSIVWATPGTLPWPDGRWRSATAATSTPEMILPGRKPAGCRNPRMRSRSIP